MSFPLHLIAEGATVRVVTCHDSHGPTDTASVEHRPSNIHAGAVGRAVTRSGVRSVEYACHGEFCNLSERTTDAHVHWCSAILVAPISSPETAERAGDAPIPLSDAETVRLATHEIQRRVRARGNAYGLVGASDYIVPIFADGMQATRERFASALTHEGWETLLYLVALGRVDDDIMGKNARVNMAVLSLQRLHDDLWPAAHECQYEATLPTPHRNTSA